MDQEDTPLFDPSELDADPEFTHSVGVRNRVRSKLESDIDAFLRQGGRIECVADNHRADPPKRPESRYGRRSI